MQLNAVPNGSSPLRIILRSSAAIAFDIEGAEAKSLRSSGENPATDSAPKAPDAAMSCSSVVRSSFIRLFIFVLIVDGLGSQAFLTQEMRR